MFIGRTTRLASALLGLGALALPTQAATGPNLFVSVPANHNIEEFDPSGALVRTFGQNFTTPEGLTFNSQGDLFVADFARNDIQEYDAAGDYLQTFGQGLNRPYGLAVNAQDDLFVADGHNHQIQEYDSTGHYLASFGQGLSNPIGLAEDGQGDLFVADLLGGQVQEYNAANAFVSTLIQYPAFYSPYGLAEDGAGDLYASVPGRYVQEYNAGGTATATFGQTLGFAYGLAVNPGGDLFVGDYYDNDIAEFGPGGVALGTFAQNINGPTWLTFGPAAVPNVAAVPEAPPGALLGMGLLLAGLLVRRRQAPRTSAAAVKLSE